MDHHHLGEIIDLRTHGPTIATFLSMLNARVEARWLRRRSLHSQESLYTAAALGCMTTPASWADQHSGLVEA